MLLFYFILSGILLATAWFAKNYKIANFIPVIFGGLQIAFAANSFNSFNSTELSYFKFDNIALIFIAISTFLYISTWYHSIHYLKDENNRNIALYNIGLMGLCVTLSGVYTSNNALVSWIFIEATTIFASVLIYHNRHENSLEATWKYLFVCSVGIAIAYIGLLFVTNGLDIREMNMSYEFLKTALVNANPLYLKISFLFILVGYSAKMEIFPFYTIGVDANYVAPAPASAFLSTALVNGGFVSIYRIYKIYNTEIISAWLSHVLILTGIITLLISTAYIYKTKNLKRMFAYSTVENMAIVTIGLGIGGAGELAAVLQVILHSFAKSILFYQSGILHKYCGTYKIMKLGEYSKVFPTGAIILIIAMFGITAIPPSGLFFAEFVLFQALITSKSYWIFAIIVLLLTVVIYSIFSKVLSVIYKPDKVEYNTQYKAPKGQILIQILILLVLISAIFLYPLILNNV